MDNKTKEILQAMHNTLCLKSKELSDSMNELTINIGATGSEDKSFDHFMKWSLEAVNIAERIVKLGAMLNEDQEEEEADEQASDKLSLRWKNK